MSLETPPKKHEIRLATGRAISEAWGRDPKDSCNQMGHGLYKRFQK